jgi:hypothetical protein
MKEKGVMGQTLDEKLASARSALAALEREQKTKEEAERAAAAKAAAAAARELLTGHSRALADAHESKLRSLDVAESHAAAMVAAINAALAAEVTERSAAGAMATDMNVRTDQLNLSGDEFVRRITGGLCAHLTRISACRMRRLGALVLLDDPRTRGAETWAEREATATRSSVQTLLATAETQKEAA